jgi:hypothetical protein
MDERETVNRRDAVAGLSLIGVLTLALVGTIFYRIVAPPPPTKRPPEIATLAAQPGDIYLPLSSSAEEIATESLIQPDKEVRAAAHAEDRQASSTPVDDRPQFMPPAEH